MIRLDTLGSTRVFKAGQEATSLASQPLRCALLIYLVLERTTTREKVLGVFWPEQDDKSARHALSQNLYELRRLLGEEWLRTQGDELSLNVPVELDVQEFTEASERGDYGAALRIYRGPFLRAGPIVSTHPWEEWVDQRAFKLRRAWIRAGQAKVRELTDAGDIDEAVETARRVVELEPQEDQLQHQLIDLLRLSGRRAEALAQYELYERALRADDLEPLDQTRELVTRIREGEALPELSGISVARVPPSSGAPGQGAAPAATEDWQALESRLKTELAPGTEVIRLLGHGNVANVYLAREAALRRLVAIKVLAPQLARNPTVRLRFEREAQAIASILHPHVISIFRVDRLSDNQPFLIMQYVKGRSLADLLLAEGRLDVPQVRRIMADLAAALAATHKKGIVHRDVRPANVIIDEESGHAVLTDFGIAAIMESGDERALHLTRTGEVLGDPAYISPEQRTGRSFTELADVYSLGVLGYEILTNRKPSAEPGAAPPTVAALRPDVDPALADLVHRCLSANPAHRPSASDIVRQLRPPVQSASAPEPGPAPVSAPNGPAANAVTADSGSGQTPEEKTGMNWLFSELKRRRVLRVTAVYIVAAVAVVEAANSFFPALRLPSWTITLVAALAILGLPVVVALAWAFDITPQGVVRTKSRT